MTPLQKEGKNRQDNSDDLFLSEINGFDQEQINEIGNSTIFHGELVKKIDSLFREQQKKTILDELTSIKHPTIFSEEYFIELRKPLYKRVKTSRFHITNPTQNLMKKKQTIPDEFKTEFLMIHHPSFKFVSNLHQKEDILLKQNPGDAHVEIIDCSTIVKNSGAIKKTMKETKESDTSQSKKQDIKVKEKSEGNEYSDICTAALPQSEEDSDKAKIYYLNSKKVDEKKLKEIFEDKVNQIKEKEQKELEKLKRSETKKEQRQREKEEKKLKKLEEKKKKLEANQKNKDEKKKLAEKLKKESEEKKALAEKLKKEAKERKLLQTETKHEESQNQESVALTKGEKRLKKLEAKQKKKEEKEALIKTLETQAQEKKLKKKKTKHGEADEIKHTDMATLIKTEKQQSFVDDEVIKVLRITDDLLGYLPQDVIDKFTKSEDFILYEKVISKYKNK